MSRDGDDVAAAARAVTADFAEWIAREKHSVLHLGLNEMRNLQARIEAAFAARPGGLAAQVRSELVRKYYVKGDERAGNAAYVEHRGQYRGEGPVLWAVTAAFSQCLSKEGRWEWEPQPSSRTDAFIRRCRWTSFEEALAFAEKSGLPE